MTAPFAVDLCGYRSDVNPSTADGSQKGSIAWGHALFAALGVPPTKTALPDSGDKLEALALADLKAHHSTAVFNASAPVSRFDQYEHLGVFKAFQDGYAAPGSALADACELSAQLPKGQLKNELRARLQAAIRESAKNHAHVEEMLGAMARESILKIDLAVSDPAPSSRLRIAVSSKWSLRTDRAQDCVAQGQKLANLRRGHMPHFAVLTMEPRPAMLQLIAYGSGAVDCVYHVALPDLLRAADALVANAATDTEHRTYSRQREDLRLMVAQRRLRAYSELAAEVDRL